MKSIIVNGNKFEYLIASRRINDKWFYYTNFYQGTRTKTYRKYWIFGERISREVPNFVFQIDINIEDPCHTKDEVRSRIFQQLALMDRIEQIKRGEII